MTLWFQVFQSEWIWSPSSISRLFPLTTDLEEGTRRSQEEEEVEKTVTNSCRFTLMQTKWGEKKQNEKQGKVTAQRRVFPQRQRQRLWVKRQNSGKKCDFVSRYTVKVWVIQRRVQSERRGFRGERQKENLKRSDRDREYATAEQNCSTFSCEWTSAHTGDYKIYSPESKKGTLWWAQCHRLCMAGFTGSNSWI